jgi:myo-inositol-hexaphosphate 3-phosphohydrolase
MKSSKLKKSKDRKGFCIYIETFCQGHVPLVSDGENNYVIFDTELEAQKEIVDNQMTRLQQFLDGERDYLDAITVEEYVVAVTLMADGTIRDEEGRKFQRGPE